MEFSFRSPRTHSQSCPRLIAANADARSIVNDPAALSSVRYHGNPRVLRRVLMTLWAACLIAPLSTLIAMIAPTAVSFRSNRFKVTMANTWLGATKVIGNQPFRDGAISLFVGPSVGTHIASTTKGETAITVLVNLPCPKPTVAEFRTMLRDWARFVDLCPKPLLWRTS